MAKEKLTPNRAAYDKLCVASKSELSKILILTNEATWFIVRSPSQASAPLEHDVQQIFHGWEDMLACMSHKSLITLHQSFWPDIKIGKALESKEALCVLIWNYRLSKAVDLTVSEAAQTIAKNPLQRASSIAGRTYRIITPSKDAKPFTSKAGLACLAIIKDVCGEAGICSEGDLKLVVCSRGMEITKTAEADPTSAWRFLQFYRPLLVESELIEYKK